MAPRLIRQGLLWLLLFALTPVSWGAEQAKVRSLYEKRLEKVIGYFDKRVRRAQEACSAKKRFTLGKGGYGKVCMCERSGAFVCEKTTKSEPIATSHAVFERLKGLDVPYILAPEPWKEVAEGVWTQRQPAGFSMDLVQFAERIGKVPPREVAVIIAQIARGLKALRSIHVGWHDLKPDNILIDPHTLRVQLIDFDFGLIYETEDRHNIARGTRVYAAPEVVFLGHMVWASDLWSLGKVAHMLAQEGVSSLETLRFAHKGPFPPDSRVALADFVMSVLEIRAEDRLGAKSIDDLLAHPFIQSAHDPWASASHEASHSSTEISSTADAA